MRTCPRCEANDQDTSDFCKKCGYKFSGPTLGLLQCIPRKRAYQSVLKEQLHAEGIKKGGTGMTKEQPPALFDGSDLVDEKEEKERGKISRTYFPLHLSNVFSQKWAIFAGSIILSLVAAIIYCSAIHCAA
jgi:hypothetical protein